MNCYFFGNKSLLLLIGLFCFIYLSAQDQRMADSLVMIYNENKIEEKEKLQLLKDLAYNEMDDLQKALSYCNELIELAQSMNDLDFLYSGHLQKGYKYSELGKFELALTEFIESGKIAKSNNNISAQGIAYVAIGDLYVKMNLFPDAEENYDKAIELLRKTDQPIKFAYILLNMGEMFFLNKNYEKALQFYEESLPILKSNNDSIGISYNLGNTGMVYSEQKNDSMAENSLEQAIDMLEVLKDYSAISTYLLYLSDIEARKGNMTTAFNHANRSLQLAQDYSLKKQKLDAYQKLSELYKLINDDEKASDYYNKYIYYKNIIFNVDSERKIGDLRVKLKNAEIESGNQKRKTQRIIIYTTILALFLIALLAYGLFHRNKFIKATNKIIALEKERSDNLLLNILPEETAQELKDRGKVQAKRFESVTVLFTDFEGFTRYSEHLSPEEVVTTIDFYFSKFDEIIEKYGLEKIKTVGDAYMCAGGLPIPSEDHAHKVVLAAIEIINFVHQAKSNFDGQLAQFDIIIGINTGPVVAGVVGSKKFAYDIWGDSVNIASRMESSSEPGKINISENTYELIKDKFNCKFRGNIEVKNRGLLKMYFVENQILSS